MAIGGIGAVGYPAAGYTVRKTEGEKCESVAVGFMKTVAEKAAQDNAVDYDEKAFASVGANAPQLSWQPSRHFMI